MTNSTVSEAAKLFKKFRQRLAERFSLLDDKADDSVIDESIRNDIELKGATPWILMFAILIASIGLNVNSAAVIIGAMLISPLMAPIMGIGYGVGIYDFPLLKKSLLNFGIVTAISLITSTIYFLVSPLSEAHSELFARTSPTIWDVLIAFFGGLAGIVGATRKVKSNVIPGVAIATALMPPLCTAGYGLANGNWEFLFGAFYLYAINCVFIALATVVVIWLLKMPRHKFVDNAIENRVKKVLIVIVLLTALPSTYLTYKLVKDEIFNVNASQFVKNEFSIEGVNIVDVQIFPSQRKIEVTLIGESVSQDVLKVIEAHLDRARLSGSSLIVHQANDNRVDVSSLKAGILSDLYRDSLMAVKVEKDKVMRLEAEINSITVLRRQFGDIALELKAQYPQFNEIIIGEGMSTFQGSVVSEQPVTILIAKSTTPLKKLDKKRINDWFQVRVKSESIRLVIEP